ncbi:hypothetical protein B0H14DRAFT_2593823 [Mycena olivaceomarginata]|nr:hypothetical protein B0H14DRAFT_2593823 [Mycena olivaceomarginata]
MFKCVEGDMDEWVVSGFSDRFKHCELPGITCLYCSKKSAATLLRAVRLYPRCNWPKTQALEFEKQAWRDWVTQRGEIDTQMKVLRAGPLKGVQINRCQPVAALSDTAIPDDLNNGQEECFNDDMGQPKYFPSDYIISGHSHHLWPLELHWNAAFELDLALEPNYHALGGSDYAMADYNVSGLDYVLPLPPPSPPVQPPALPLHLILPEHLEPDDESVSKRLILQVK